MRVLAYLRYTAMVKYELAYSRKIAEICADFDQHARWLTAQRELAKLDKEWEKLPFDQQYLERLPINKRRAEFEKFRFDTPNMWLGVPNKPNLTPSEEAAFLSRHTVTILNALRGDGTSYEELNTYLMDWLKSQIVVGESVRPLSGAAFMQKTKEYPFLDQLLPKERNQFNLLVDSFLIANPDFRELQINVTLPNDPSRINIVSAGRRHLSNIKAFEERLLAFLKSTRLDAGAETSSTSRQ